jgi:hypothetical protein
MIMLTSCGFLENTVTKTLMHFTISEIKRDNLSVSLGTTKPALLSTGAMLIEALQLVI